MVVFLCLCDGVFFVLAVMFLRRNYAKSVDNTGVKRYPVQKFSLHCSYSQSHQTFPLLNCLHSTVFNAFGISGV